MIVDKIPTLSSVRFVAGTRNSSRPSKVKALEESTKGVAASPKGKLQLQEQGKEGSVCNNRQRVDGNVERHAQRESAGSAPAEAGLAVQDLIRPRPTDR